MYATLDELTLALSALGDQDADYVERMYHTIPQARSVDRVKWLIERCKDKTVLHLGSKGPLHGLLKPVCTRLYGVDLERHGPDTYAVNLDWEPDALPELPDVEVVLAAEIVEHLVNPGFVLKMVQELYGQRPLIVTAPNAFFGQPRLAQGIEHVHVAHTCWYSPHTLQVMLAQCGYQVREFLWYHGKPMTAEGMIVVAEAQHV